MTLGIPATRCATSCKLVVAGEVANKEFIHSELPSDWYSRATSVRMRQLYSKLNDAELLQLFNKVQQLNDEDVTSVKAMLMAFVFQKDIQKQLA